MHEQMIVIIDDNAAIVSFLRQLLDDEGYRTVSDTHGASAHTLVQREQPNLVILDLWMERQETGWDILRQIRADDTTAQIPVLVCSADVGAIRTRTDELSSARYDTLEKPFAIDALLGKITRLLG